MGLVDPQGDKDYVNRLTNWDPTALLGTYGLGTVGQNAKKQLNQVYGGKNEADIFGSQFGALKSMYAQNQGMMDKNFQTGDAQIGADPNLKLAERQQLQNEAGKNYGADAIALGTSLQSNAENQYTNALQNKRQSDLALTQDKLQALLGSRPQYQQQSNPWLDVLKSGIAGAATVAAA